MSLSKGGPVCRRETGNQGPQGPFGPQGLIGLMGLQGIQGIQGIQGKPGTPGSALAYAHVPNNSGADHNKGIAPSNEAREHATTLAQNVKGVSSVDNQLTVKQ